MRAAAQHRLVSPQHAQAVCGILPPQRSSRPQDVLEQRAVVAFAQQTVEQLETFSIGVEAVPAPRFEQPHLKP